MLVLAGDIGGTNSRLALYRDTNPLFERTYPSGDFPSLEIIVEKFIDESIVALGPDARPDRACFGIAGPVENDTSRVTNLPWFLDARKIEARTRIPRVSLINDFQAAALGVTILKDSDLVQIGGGARDPKGAIAVAGAGTGLGEAFLFWSPADNRHQVAPSEGGHVDFTPRTALEFGLLSFLQTRYGRVSYERVLSGQGIADIFSFLSNEPACKALVREETHAAMVNEDPAAVVSRMALSGADPVCLVAMNLFVSILGGLAGNLALQFLSAGGVFIAGGIAPRILPLMQNGTFREAFEAKGRFQSMVAKIPAYVVTHKDVGRLGAVVAAQRIP